MEVGKHKSQFYLFCDSVPNTHFSNHTFSDRKSKPSPGLEWLRKLDGNSSILAEGELLAGWDWRMLLDHHQQALTGLSSSLFQSCCDCVRTPRAVIGQTFRRYVCVHVKSLQSCPTLCNRMDCSPPGSSVHGILQARILEYRYILH